MKKSNPKFNLSNDMPYIDYEDINSIRPSTKHPRQCTQRQTESASLLISSAGIMLPIIVDKNGEIIIGEEWFHSYKSLRIEKVPIIRANNLSASQLSMLKIGFYKIIDLGHFDEKKLADEVKILCDTIFEFNLQIIGFDPAEEDSIISKCDLIEDMHIVDEGNDESELPEIDERISKLGDEWQLGEHILFHGDSTSENSYKNLLGENEVDCVITDPPYNVKSNKIGGKGKKKHPDFIQGSGEFSEGEFVEFLCSFLRHCITSLKDGGLLYSYMDWRNIYALEIAARKSNLKLMNFCVWNKNNGGMGSMYRSKHELVPVYKKGTKPHCNNIQLGKHGRYRTNVWDYAGVNSFKSDRMAELDMHPTVKPVDMIADIIRDCTKRNHIVLDPFCGSGTILIACEMTNRKARAIELDGQYVDTAIRRWEKYTGKKAILVSTGQVFQDVKNNGRINSQKQGVGHVRSR